MVHVFRYILASLIGLFSFSSQDAVAQSPNRKLSAQERSGQGEKSGRLNSRYQKKYNENLLFAWIGTGLGATYLHNISENVALGGQISMNTEKNLYYNRDLFTNNFSSSYRYDLRYSVESLSAAAQASWLSNRDEGFLIAAVAGVTRLSSSASGTRELREIGTSNPTDSVQMSQTVSSVGASGGIQTGYIWTISNGLSFGLQANLIASTAELPMFDSLTPKVTQDSEAMKDLNDSSNQNVYFSSLGLVIGVAF